MNARNFRINMVLSPLDFPAITGLGQSYVSYQSEPKMVGNKVSLSITKTYFLIDTFINKKHEVLSAESVYEIPPNEIKTREDVYDFYKDALLALDEAYRHAQSQLQMLPSRLFPNQPIESYKPEIDRVFNLLNSRN